MAMEPVPFDQLADADLEVDRVYQGGTAKNIGSDPVAKLLKVGNQGGFRYYGSPVIGKCRVVVLYSSGSDTDWPDVLDPFTGRFLYYGDNKSPGPLHRTKRRGNELLRQTFEATHASIPERASVPPYFVFFRGAGWDVVFRGLAAPGAPETSENDDLVAVWRTSGGSRFQNYRAAFTILDAGIIPRAWIKELEAGQVLGPHCPAAWRTWVETGRYAPLVAPPTTTFRTPAQQLPESALGRKLMQAMYGHFKDDPWAFERCAGSLWNMVAPTASIVDYTRRTRDGGRDAVGWYPLGPAADEIRIDFALEAKCYALTSSVGVKELSRLISRLRHRQFGVLVTTSFLNTQAYKELREDGHPVVVLAARDIVDALKSNNLGSVKKLKAWLSSEFPV